MKKLFLSIVTLASFVYCCHAQTHDEKAQQFRQHIKHIVVIYEENWSFDGLYGKFAHANNIDSAMECGKNYVQVDENGSAYISLPMPKNAKNKPDTRFTIAPPNKPYDLKDYNIDFDSITGDITHRFYTEQGQIDNGAMDKFAVLSENSGLTMSYFDTRGLPEYKLAKKYTLCDNFFHSAFGGSFLNHQWLVAARTPQFEGTPPQAMVSIAASKDLYQHDNVIDTDGHSTINTILSENGPHPDGYKKTSLTSQHHATIGNRMDDAGISWAWYSEGWTDRLNGVPDPKGLFQYHHQPFVYFDSYKAEGAKDFKGKRHLKDERDFVDDVKNKMLPQVCFLKALGDDNEHPSSSDLKKSQDHVKKLVDLIMKNKEYKNNTAIIITYDENGGRWDHVSPPPPAADRQGPASRVPALVISKYAKRKTVDKTQYETVSILRTIELIYNLPPLTDRDAKANDMLNAFEFK